MAVAGRLEDLHVLKRCIRELVGLSTLPAAWSGTATHDIPDGLAQILLKSLAAEFVYVRIADSTCGHTLEAVRASVESPAGDKDAVCRGIAPYVGDGAAASAVIPHPVGNGNVRIAVAPIGVSRDPGVVVAASPRHDFPLDTERVLLEVAANQTAVVLKQRRDEEERERIVAREQTARRDAETAVSMLQRLETVLEATLAPRRLNELLPDLLRRTRTALDADTGVILLLDADQQSFLAAAADGFHEDLGPPVPIPVGAGVAGHIAISDAGLIIEDLATVELIRTSLRESICSLAGVPLRLRERLIGVLHIGSATRRQFTSADLGFLRMVADFAALAIERVRLDEAEQTAHAELERAARLKDEFLAVLSHELRTPMNAVLGYAHLLEQKSLPPERAEHALQAIQRNAQAQARMIESLLDVSRIMAGKLELELRPLDVWPVVQASVDALRPMADAGQILLDAIPPGAPLVVVADHLRLEQVLWNLLSNAIKFTPPGGRVRVGLVRTESRAQIQVTDTGEGIRAEFLPHIFNRFSQADATARARGGLGLGLALVRELVHAHGGSVTADSPGEGRGSTFVVTLPVSVDAERPGDACATAGDMEPVEPSETLPHVRVLIVDDDPDARDWLGFMLESRGASVQTVSSAREAFEAITRHRPEVLIADLRMPEEDGFKLIRKLRARERDEHEPRLPAIAVTAYAGGSDRERAIAAGFDGHVAKPVNVGELISAVTRIIGRSSV
jgi:hypothetical protein